MSGSSSKNTGYISSCADIYGKAFADLKFRIYDYTDNSEVEEHPFNKLLRKPNDFQSRWEMFYRIGTDFTFHGNSYFLKWKTAQGIPFSLIQLHPDRITTKPDGIERIEYYEYNTGSNMLRLEKDEVIHFRYPDPNNYIMGTSIISKVMDLKDVEKMQMEYQKKFYKNGGFMGATFTTDAKLDKDTFNRMLEQLQKKYGGEGNAFQVGLFEQGTQPIATAYSIKDMDLTAQRNLNKQEILAAFQINKLLLGESELVQRGNAETIDYIFSKNVIDPLGTYIDETLTNQLISVDYDIDYYCKHDTVAVRDVEKDIKYYQAGIGSGYLTPNEVREMEGFEPLDGGDILKDINKIEQNDNLKLWKSKYQQN